MAFALTDFPNAKLDVQKYIPVSAGIMASYERDLVPSAGALAYISDEVDLYATATKAQSDAAALERLPLAADSAPTAVVT